MQVQFELKKTINLPKTSFPQKANLEQAEPARLARWGKLYEQIRKSRVGRRKFILHDGPPYANSDIHLGTALNKILKDFVIKSRTMMGYDVPYVPGYDCHGLPIELYVDKKLGSKKAQMPPASIRRACREHASEALQRQTRDFRRLGVFGNWEEPYLTMSKSYEATTARVFSRFVERGLVYRGARPVYWCVNDQTALAEAEVEYNERTDPSVYVKFPLISDPAQIDPALAGHRLFFIIWTTTPWTLPANLGIAVHPKFEYSAIQPRGSSDVYIVARDLVEAVVEKCRLGEITSLASFPGAVLDRLECRHAWLDQTSLIMTGEHVTLGGEADAETELDVKDARHKKVTGSSGTGCVHTAPGHGHDDFVIGTKYGLDPYCPVDSSGHFTGEVEHFAGLQVFEANRQITEFMRDRGILLLAEDYNHRYPHCWRCHGPLIFRATPQWFISLNNSLGGVDEHEEIDDDGRISSSFANPEFDAAPSLREAALREVERVKWIPAWGRERMRNMLSGRPDWCISRQRLWGVPIPVFYCSDCEEMILNPKIIDHVADIFEAESTDAWYEHEAVTLLPNEFRCPKCGKANWRKETDILDVWFDSGSSSIAVLEQSDDLRWPADVYLEGGDQYRGWFNSSLIIALAAHETAPYKTVLTHGWLLDGQGKAMHKSAGNAVSPNDVIKAYGAEVLRLWSASSDYHEDMRCSTEILSRISDAYRKIRNTARFALGNLDGFNMDADCVQKIEMLEIDRWALEELKLMTQRVISAYESFEFHTVYHALYHFCTVTLSARYFDIIKDRLYIYAPRSRERRSAQTALYEIASALARLLAPILVFTADEIWENLPQHSSEEKAMSVHVQEFPVTIAEHDLGLDSEFLARWARLFEIRDRVLGKLEEARSTKLIGSSLEARLVISAGDSFELLKSFGNDLRYIFIVSQVELKPSKGDSEGEMDLRVERALGAKCERCWNYSVHVGTASQDYPTVCERCAVVLKEIAL